MLLRTSCLAVCVLIPVIDADAGDWLHRRHRSKPCSPPTLFRWSASPTTKLDRDYSEPLVTDRPDFTEASSTVGLGTAQLEFGYTFLMDDDGGGDRVREHSWGEPLLRYGILADWLELRIAVFPLTERSSETVGGVQQPYRQTSGVGDLYLGLKLGLTPQCGVLPEMALIPQMLVPTATSSFGADTVRGGANLIYSWEINDCISIAGSTQANRLVEDNGDAYLSIAQSGTVAYTLTDELGAYTEFFSFFPSSAESARTEHYFNGGFTYLINKDVQFDIRAGLGLNEDAADFFCGTGLSVRLR